MLKEILQEDKIIVENNEALKKDRVIESMESKLEKPKVITGLLGKSEKTGYWRIYRTVYLNKYIEVAEKDIIAYSLELPSNPLGGSIVKIRPNATIKNVRTTFASERDFLEGDIVREFLSDSTIDFSNVIPMATTPTSTPCITVTMCLRNSPTKKIFVD